MAFLDKFRRITSSNNFIPEIDGLRFFAIVPVMLLHIYKHYLRTFPDSQDIITNQPFDRFLSFGGVGVEVFFVISGCILGMPFAKHALLGAKKQSIKAYFIRRLTRLEPPFILCILGIYAMHFFVNSGNSGFTPSHLFATLTYTHSLIFGAWSPINPVTWSLEAEVQFYILAPLLSSIFFVKKKTVRRCIMVGFVILWTCFIARFYHELIALHLSMSVVYYICLFFIGFLLSDVLLIEMRNNTKHSYLWDVVCLLSMCGIFTFAWKHQNPPLHLLLLLSIFLFCASVFRSKLFNKFYTSKIVTTIGGMCYSLYLLHYPLIVFLMPYTLKIHITEDLRWNLLLQIIILLPTIIILVAIFFRLIERPCMRKDWYKVLWKKFQVKLNTKKCLH